ncbi:MAG: hypothetical protein K1X28_01705 [Parachlamydiales bacterium]|nr:hypothetical protein [Parachlamydiales bacterium]
MNTTETNQEESFSFADYWQTTSNVLQWGLIGAAYFGVGAAATVPLSIISAVGSEIAAASFVPVDAPISSALLSSPTLQNLLLDVHPVAKAFAEAVSIYHFSRTALKQLGEIWTGMRENPRKNLKKAVLNLFNIASRIAFLANKAGLIDFSPQKAVEAPKKEKGLCDPSKEKGCEGPVLRKIRIATVCTQNKDARAQAICDLVSENHGKYAEHWGLKHEAITGNLVAGQCNNPTQKGLQETCSPDWNKIKYFQNWCSLPPEAGTEEWAVYTSGDAVYTNFAVDPSSAIDQLRGVKDTSFIISTEGEGTRYNAGAVNTGVMIVRKDPRGCGVIDRIWKNRNAVTDPKNTECPTFGLCKDRTNGADQGAADKLFHRDQPSLIGTDVTRILSRDSTHPKRGHIAFNTLNRGGCITALQSDGFLTEAYDISTHDLKVNPDGIWQEGDWIGQTAGYPLAGQDLSHQSQCISDPSAPIEPIRIKKIQQMIAAGERSLAADPREPREIEPYYVPIQDTASTRYNFTAGSIPRYDRRELTFGAVYDNHNEPNRNAISDFVNQNHAEYCKRWGMRHEVISHGLLSGLCTDPATQKPADCAPFWNKIQMYRNWLEEPAKPGVEEWRYYADDDMLVTNMGVDPYQAIDILRKGKDTSFIVAEDVIDWQRWFFETSHPHLSVNTGALILRKDQRSRELIDAIWEARNRPPLKPTPDCPTIGMCKLQSGSMQEQEALTLVLRNNPDAVGNVVTIVPPRGDLGMNTFFRDGCFSRKLEGWAHQPFTYEPMDEAENPDGAFIPGDWLVQAAGVPVWGKSLPMTSGVCADDPKVPEGPVRLNKLKELSQFIIRGGLYDVMPRIRFLERRFFKWLSSI